MPLDPKGSGYSDNVGAPGKAVLLLPDGANTPPAAIVSSSLPVPQAAPRQIPATPADLLISGQWKLSSKTRNDIRVFMKDGTFKTLNTPAATGQWEITKDFVIMLLPGGHKDVIYLPLNPAGSSGLADNGDALTATLENPAPTGGPTADVPTSNTIAAPTQSSAADVLVSAPWTISSEGDAASSRVRTFARDGTFSTAGHEDEYGWWKIVNNIVILTFADEHKESLKLPLNPKGTSGLDKSGSPISAVQKTPVK